MKATLILAGMEFLFILPEPPAWDEDMAPCWGSVHCSCVTRPGVHWPGYWHQAAHWNTIGQWSKLPPPVTIFSIHTSHHSGLWAGIQANQCTEPKMYPHHRLPWPVSGNLQIEDCLSSVFITIIPPTLLNVGINKTDFIGTAKIHNWLLFSFNWKIWLTLVLWWGNHNKWKF